MTDPFFLEKCAGLPSYIFRLKIKGRSVGDRAYLALGLKLGIFRYRRLIIDSSSSIKNDNTQSRLSGKYLITLIKLSKLPLLATLAHPTMEAISKAAVLSYIFIRYDH